MTANRTDRRHRTGRRAGLAALAAFTFLGLAAPAAHAQVGIGVKAGTQGPAFELTSASPPRLSGRLGINGFSYSDRREAGGIEYDADADLRTANALLDFHPGRGGFRLTGGL